MWVKFTHGKSEKWQGVSLLNLSNCNAQHCFVCFTTVITQEPDLMTVISQVLKRLTDDEFKELLSQRGIKSLLFF